LPIVVPCEEGEEAKIPSFDNYWLKIRLLRDLSELPAEVFIQSQSVFEATMTMIEYHLLYRLQEYSKLLQWIMDKDSSIEDEREQKVSERAWNLILKPVHLILNKIIRLNSKQSQIESTFIVEIIQLMSSPVEEEARMMFSLIQYILFNSNLVTSRAVIAGINNLIEKSISGEFPFITIVPILRFIGDSMMLCSQKPESFVTKRISEIVRTRVIPLHGHLNFFLIQEDYTNSLIQYFIFFEVSEGMSIRRTPFDPNFPEFSPFNNSKDVNIVRRALIRRYNGENDQNCRLNQIAKFDSMFKLMTYQFYPRVMIVDILESIKAEFVYNLSIEAVFLFYAFITKEELLRSDDEVSSSVKSTLSAMKEDISRCQSRGHGLGRICGLVSQKVELIIKS
jgi:hypothetical protein